LFRFGLAGKIVVGDRQECTIQAVDKFSNHLNFGGAIFSAKVTGPEGELKLPPVKDNADGTYTVRYTTTDPGNHIIVLFYKSVRLRGTPYVVTAKWTKDQMCKEIKKLRQETATLTTKYTELQQSLLASEGQMRSMIETITKLKENQQVFEDK